MNIDFLQNLRQQFAVPNNGVQRPPLLAAGNSYPNLSPLKKDTVSFKGTEKAGKNTQKVKKSDFKSFDLAAIEKFRVNISGFKTVEDLQTWAKKKLQTEYIEKNYEGRLEDTQEHRKVLLKEWFDYVTKENDAYTPVMQLLIIDAITKDLKTNNDKIPPVLNKGILADVMTQLQESLEKNPTEPFNLNKIYQTHLHNKYICKTKSGEKRTGWIVIPSKKHDPKHFEDNVNKLKTLSHSNWCTKSFNAEPYLSDGDFHIYLKNGKPILAIRFVDNKIEEIQGERNNSQIPLRNLTMIKKYIEKNEFKLNAKATREIDAATKGLEKFNEIKKKIGKDAIKRNNPDEILPFFGIKVIKDTDGMFIINKYQQPAETLSFEDFGINETEMFKKIKKIEGNANFSNSALKSLYNIEEIDGNLELKDSYIENLGNLESISGNVNFSGSKIENLENLKHIGGNVDFGDSLVTSLGELSEIGGNATFSDSLITELENLEYIGGNAFFNNSIITSLGKLKEIEGKAVIRASEIKDIGELRRIGGSADFRYSEVKDLKYLEEIEGDADFSNSELQNLGELQVIGGDANFDNTDLISLGKLKSIGGQLSAEYCSIPSYEFWEKFEQELTNEEYDNDDDYDDDEYDDDSYYNNNYENRDDSELYRDERYYSDIDYTYDDDYNRYLYNEEDDEENYD